MKRLSGFVFGVVSNPRVLVVLALLALLAVALTAGAPEVGSCISGVC